MTTRRRVLAQATVGRSYDRCVPVKCGIHPRGRIDGPFGTTDYGDARYRCTPPTGEPHAVAAVGILNVWRRGWFLPGRGHHIYGEWRSEYEHGPR